MAQKGLKHLCYGLIPDFTVDATRSGVIDTLALSVALSVDDAGGGGAERLRYALHGRHTSIEDLARRTGGQIAALETQVLLAVRGEGVIHQAVVAGLLGARGHTRVVRHAVGTVDSCQREENQQ